MSKTDLDWLTEEASPEEIKRLMRIAHEWSQGDEHSFPVQLALLTRAQWRAVAKIPRVIDESAVLLETKLAGHRQQLAGLVKEFSASGDAKVEALAKTASAHTQSMTRANLEMSGHLVKASHMAELIRHELQKGATALQGVEREIINERKRLEKERRDFEERRTWNAWMIYGLIGLLLIGLGIFIGLDVCRARH